MRFLKVLAILLSFLFFILAGVIAHLVLSVTRSKKRWPILNKLTQILINTFRSILGIKIEVDGNIDFLKEKGNYIISRHIGYVDGLVLGSLVPATFVSKKDITKWPLIGLVVQISGTIFVDRQHKAKVVECLSRIEKNLKDGLNVLIFPEGTSTDGTKILPFQTTFFGVPITSQASIVPVIIKYCDIDGDPITMENRDNICWYGTMDFAKHLWNLLQFKTITVRVTVKDKIKTETYSNNSLDRKKLSQECHQLILKSVDQNINAFAGAGEAVYRSPRSFK